MAEQTVLLQPSESTPVTFEAIPKEVKTYSVSVNGLVGSFKAIAPAVASFVRAEFDPSPIVSGGEFWATQTLYLPYGHNYYYIAGIVLGLPAGRVCAAGNGRFVSAELKSLYPDIFGRDIFAPISESGNYSSIGMDGKSKIAKCGNAKVCVLGSPLSPGTYNVISRLELYIVEKLEWSRIYKQWTVVSEFKLIWDDTIVGTVEVI